MTAFHYRAARLDGELLEGTIEAGSSEAALQLVEARGLFAVALAPDAQTRRRADAPIGEVAAMLAGLASLLEAGLPADRD